ncbi:universal stress protein [Ramlibacter terrae]|uniref:Universal stress protein n=1 Tax=Ramlibacter terrae TaxID=2732511 RepID=A0ABX6P368_9BURK|nr:universal stress protein [Ramlibacter terrae]
MTTCYRQILIHLDPTRAVTRRLAAALRVARHDGAAVTALYAATPSFVELAYAPEVGSVLMPDLVELDDRRRQWAIDAFDAAVKDAGLRVRWSQTAEVPVALAFAQQALYADLMVVGQQDRGNENASAVPGDFVETVLSVSGRPAPVLPSTLAGDTIGQTVWEVVCCSPVRPH